MSAVNPDDVLDLHAVRTALGGVSESTLMRLIKEGRFPQPFSVTKQGKAWFRRDVDWYLWGRQIRPRMTPRQKKAPSTAVNRRQPPVNRRQVANRR